MAAAAMAAAAGREAVAMAAAMAVAMAAAGRGRWQGWRRGRPPGTQLDVVRGGDGDERAVDGHVAEDGEQHELAELGHDLIVAADLPWESTQGVRYRGGAGRRMLRRGIAHRLSPRPCRQATQCAATGQANPAK